jgi:hypothetical protein
MKTIQSLFISSILCFVFAGCDELIPKVIDVPVSFELIQEIEVPESNNYLSYFEYDGYFDVFWHPDVQNVIGTRKQLLDLRINKIQYEFKNFKGNVDAVIRGDLILPKPSDITETRTVDVLYEIPDIKVAEADLFNEIFTFKGNYDKVNDYLYQTLKFEYSISGVSTRNPVNVYMVIKVSATVSVEAELSLAENF